MVFLCVCVYATLEIKADIFNYKEVIMSTSWAGSVLYTIYFEDLRMSHETPFLLQPPAHLDLWSKCAQDVQTLDLIEKVALVYLS